MQKHILITGGFGYVGSRLTPLLLEKGYKVRVIDLMLYSDSGLKSLEKNFSAEKLASDFSFIKGDIRDPQTVMKALESIDCVIHLAAISNDPTGDIDEVLTRQVNFDAVGMLVSLAKENGVQRFINASSSSVFGAQDASDITEELEPQPITHYSRYKMLSEWVVRSANSAEFCTVNIRPATICGVSPRQRFDLTVNKLTADGVNKKKITVHGGQQRRPNVGMTDMVNLYSLLIEVDAKKIGGKTFNFGFENHTVLKIAELIQAELKDLNVPIDVTDTQDLRDYHIDSSRIAKELGYQRVSSISQEVQALRKAIEAGNYADTDAPEHYNMQTMQLGRQNAPYSYLAS